MLFIVTYTLNPNRLNETLTQELMRSAGWTHYIDNAWLIATNENVSQLYERLRPHFLSTDAILMLEVKHNIEYQGWLPQEAWEWLTQAFSNGWARA